MTAAADLVLTNGEVHPLADQDETVEAVAVRDGVICRLGRSSELDFLVGVETTVVDLEGRVLLPGFVDAHVHLTKQGQSLVHADLRGADGRSACLERLRETAEGAGATAGPTDDWVLGFGFDESGWDDPRYLTREDLDAVSESRPVAAIREDGHVAAVNSVVLDRHLDEMPAGGLRTEGGEPTGVLVETAVDVVYRLIEPDRPAALALLRAAQAEANRLGVTGVHDMVRRSHAPWVYRHLDRTGELTLRVRVNYWSDHLDALLEAGLGTNDGSAMVRVGAVKSFTDGSLGGFTAKLSAPYADGEGVGQWVVPPDELAALAEQVEANGLQLAVHAIGDEAIDTTLEVLAGTDDPAAARHRVEHAELTTDAAIERFAELGVVASVQPNFLKWMGPDGLYERRLGPERTALANRFRDLLDAGVPLAFGSDGMPMDPLVGVHLAVNHPMDDQRLSVTEALRAYTSGGAYAGFDEDRLGTIEVGKLADLVALDRSPWDHPDAIDAIDVALTVVDGQVVYDAR